VTGRVITVGAVNVDLVIRGKQLPAPGQTVIGGSFEQHHGGKAANQAVAAARLGVRSAFVGAIGDDEFGAQARDALQSEGVDLAGLRSLPGSRTGVALILVDEAGENEISVASGANADMSANDVREALTAHQVAAGDVVLVSCEIPPAAVREALRLGHDAGATTILNPAPAVGLDRSIFGLADVLTPNRGELAAIASAEGRRTGRPFGSDQDPAQAAGSLLEANPEGPGIRLAVVVTLGASGALLARADGSVQDLPAPRIRSVDSTGAGDAFNGALAAGLAQGRALEEAARRGVAAASLATTLVGAREGMPSADELEAFLGGRPVAPPSRGRAG
jgi:ribokinase